MFGQWINQRMRAALFALIGVMLLMSGPAWAATISGTAPDGILVAVDSNNTVMQIVEGVATPGMPVMTGKTASMSGLPITTDITLYLFTDGVLFPMVFNGTVTTFRFMTETTLDVGFIKIDYMAGNAYPINPITNMSVQPSTPVPVSLKAIQDSLVASLGTTMTVNDWIEGGKTAIRHGWAVAADKFFEQADILATAGTDVVLKNKTHLFRAISRVAALSLNTAASSSTPVTNFASPGTTFGDLLAGFGCNQRHLGIDEMNCPTDQALKLMSLPNGADISGWLNGNMIPAYLDAIALLNAIPNTMTPFSEIEEQWTNEPDGGATTEIDYADVLVLKGMMEFMLGQLYLNQAYNWTIDIDAALNISAQQMLIDNPNFGILSTVSSTNLANAKTHMTNAVNNLQAAMVAIQAEIDPQSDDLITLSPQEVVDASHILNAFNAALTTLGPTTLSESGLAGARTMTWNLSKLFDGISIRAILPAFTGDKVSGLFPVDASGKVTFGGFFPDGFYNFNHDSLNHDANNNNIPDILEETDSQGNQPPPNQPPPYQPPTGGGTPFSVSTVLNLTVGTPGAVTVTGGTNPYIFHTDANFFTVDTTGQVTCSASGMDGMLHVSDATTPTPNQQSVMVNCSAAAGGGGETLSVSASVLNLTMGGSPGSIAVTGGISPYTLQNTGSFFSVSTLNNAYAVTCSAAGTGGVIHISDSTAGTPLTTSVSVACTAPVSTLQPTIASMNLSVGATRSLQVADVTGTPTLSASPEGVITLATTAAGSDVTCNTAGSATVTLASAGSPDVTGTVTCVAVGTPDTAINLTEWLFPSNVTLVTQERSSHEEGTNTWVNNSIDWSRNGGTAEFLDRGTVLTEVSNDGGMYYTMTPDGMIFHGEYEYDVWNGQSRRSAEYGFVTPPNLAAGLVAADIVSSNLTQPGIMVPASVTSGASSSHVGIRYELDASNQPINDKWAVVKTEMFVTGNVNLLGSSPPAELANDTFFANWRDAVTDPALLAKLTHVLRVKMVNTRYKTFGNLPTSTETEYMYLTQGEGWVYQHGDEDHGTWKSALLAKDTGTALTSLTKRTIAAQKVRIDGPSVLTKPFIQLRAEHTQGDFVAAPHSHELIGTVNETPGTNSALFTVYSRTTSPATDVIAAFKATYGAAGFQRKILDVTSEALLAATAANPLVLPLSGTDVGRNVTFTVVNVSGTPVTDAGVQISPYNAATSSCDTSAMGAYFGVDSTTGIASAVLGDGQHCLGVWPNNGAGSFNGGWYKPSAAPGTVNVTIEGEAVKNAILNVSSANNNVILIVGTGTGGDGGTTPPPPGVQHSRVTGVLTNGTIGVNNAEVLAYPDNGGDPFVFLTDMTGAFTMDLPVGDYTFAFRYKGTGFVAQAYLVAMGETLTLSTTAGVAQNIQANTILGNVALTAAYQVPTFTLSGTVVAPTTVTGPVEVEVRSSTVGGYFAHAETTATGTYSVNVPAGAYYIEFMAQGTGKMYRGFVNSSKALSAIKEDLAPVTISANMTLNVSLIEDMGLATITISGIVKGSGDPPLIQGAKVRAVNQDSLDVLFEAETNAAGEFTLGVVPGPYKIEIFAHDYQSGWASGAGEAVTLLNDVFAQSYVLGGDGGLTALMLNPTLTKNTGGGGNLPNIDKIAITGTVTGVKGPLQNIQVEFQPDWGNNTGFVDMASVKTSATGTYTASIYPGKYRVEFRAEYWDNSTNTMVKVTGVLGRGGFATATGGTTEMYDAANVFDFTQATTVNATLSGGVEISGNVSNATGPLANVKVELQPDWESQTAAGTGTGSAPNTAIAQWVDTTTDAQGNYSVFVKPGATYRVFFNTEYWDWKTNTQVKVVGGLGGYAVGTDSKVTGDMMDAKKYTFTEATVVNGILSAGLTVSGVVTSNGTTLVGNVLVRLQPEWDPETGSSGTWGETVTAADGTYTFSVQPGLYRVEFMTTYWNWQTQSEGNASIAGLVGGFAADEVGGVINDWMGAKRFEINESIQINAKLSAGMTISGKVVTQSGGNFVPVDGAEVNAHTTDWSSNFRAKAGVDGTFTMSVNPDKEYVVEVWPKFCNAATGSGTGGTPNQAGCGGVVFQGGNWITPPQASWVTGWVAEDQNTQPLVKASTIPDSVLTYNSISGQQNGVVPGLIMSQWDDHIVTKILVDKSIVLAIAVDAGTPVTGTVLNASGLPVPYAWVNSPFGGGSTDAEGKFTINLPSSNVGTVGDGKFDVNIFPGGYMDANGAWTQSADFIGGVVTGSEATGFSLTGDWQKAVRFESDMTADNAGEVVWPSGGLVVRVGSGLSISGKVKKSDGTGIPHLWVNAWSPDSGMGGGEGTDASGNYAILVPTPATGETVWYDVNLWSDQYIAPEPVLVKMDSTGVIGVYKHDKEKFVQDDNGFFRPSAGVEITERDESGKVVVNFTLTTGNKISGRVTDSSNKGLAWTWVDIHTKDGSKWYGANTDENGYYTATVDPAANYIGVVWGWNGMYRTNFYKNATSEEDATLIDASGTTSPTNINFLMSSGAKITGSILGLKSGQSLWVNAWSESQRSWGGTEVTGTGTGITAVNFEIKGLAAAKDYRLDWNSNSETIPNGFYGGVAGSGTASGPKSWEQATLLSTMNGNVTGVAITLAVTTKTLTVKVDGLTAGTKVDVDARSEKLNKGRWKQATVAANSTSATIELKGLENSDDYRVFIGGPNVTFKVGNFMGEVSATALPTTAGSIVGWDRATKVDMSTDKYALVSVSSGRQVTVKVKGLASGQKAWVDAFSESTWAWSGGEISYGNGLTDQVVLKGLESADDYRVSIWSPQLMGGSYTGDGKAPGSWETAELVDVSTGDKTITMEVSSGKSIKGSVSGLSTSQSGWVDAWSNSTFSWGGASVQGAGATTPVAYTLAGLASAADFQVNFNSPGFVPQKLSNQSTVAGNLTGVDFTASTGGSITGAISGLNAYEWVRVDAWSPATDSFIMGGVAANSSGAATYTLSGVPAATDYVVAVWRGDKGLFYTTTGVTPVWDNHSKVTVTGSATTSSIDFNLTTAGNLFFTLSGTISGISTAQASQVVEIFAWSGTGGASTTVTGNSTFTLEGLPAGNYTVEVFTNGYIPQRTKSVTVANNAVTAVTWTTGWNDVGTVAVAGNTTGLNIALSSGYSIKGTVKNSSNAALSGVWVNAWSESASVGGGALTNSLGEFTIKGLPGSLTYKVDVWTPDGSNSVDVQVTTANKTDVALVIGKATGSITGTVSGTGAGGALILAYDSAGVEKKRVLAHATTGAYTLDDLTPDQTYSVIVYSSTKVKAGTWSNTSSGYFKQENVTATTSGASLNLVLN